MCEFCDNAYKAKCNYEKSKLKNPINIGVTIASGDYNYIDIFYSDNKLYIIAYSEGETDPIVVNYCPECGIKID